MGVEIEMDKKGAVSLNCMVRAEIEMNGGGRNGNAAVHTAAWKTKLRNWKEFWRRE